MEVTLVASGESLLRVTAMGLCILFFTKQLRDHVVCFHESDVPDDGGLMADLDHVFFYGYHYCAAHPKMNC